MSTETFPGRYESLEKICDFVTQAAENAELDESGVYACQLAVDEACTNIIEHAYGGEDRGDINCTCKVDEDKITIVLRDWGQPFDPEEIAPPNPNLPLEDVQSGGAGLFLIRKLMDEVRFRFSGKRGNTLTLVKRKRKN